MEDDTPGRCWYVGRCHSTLLHGDLPTLPSHMVGLTPVAQRSRTLWLLRCQSRRYDPHDKPLSFLTCLNAEHDPGGWPASGRRVQPHRTDR